MKVSIGENTSFVARFEKVSIQKGNFVVCQFAAKNGDYIPDVLGNDSEISFKGVGQYDIPKVQGSELKVSGSWSKNQYFTKRGTKMVDYQFKIDYIYPLAPVTDEERFKFIRSIGIGPKTARAILDRFASLENATKDIDVLVASVKTLRRAKAIRLKEAFDSSTAVREMVVLLSKAKISGSVISKIAQNYGDMSMNMIQNEPYEMLKVIGFEQCDKIALFQGKDPKDAKRVEAAVLSAMMNSRMTNSIIADGKMILDTAQQNCNLNDSGAVNADDIRSAMKRLMKNDKLVRSGSLLYFKEDYDAEVMLANKLAELGGMSADVEAVAKFWNGFDRWKAQNKGITLDPAQELAVQAASGVLSIVTGGPGVGKTTVLRAIIETYKMAFPDSPITLMAPTGLAAKRMTESCGMPATTIHKAYGLMPNDSWQGFDASDGFTIPGGLVICDEFSMVPLHLANFMMQGTNIREDTRIVLVGDVDQLPPIAPGAVLEAAIRSGKIKTTRLTKNFRQAAGSTIIDLAYAINSGRPQDIHIDGNVKFEDCANFDTDAESKEIVNKIVDEFVRSCDEYGLENTYVLSPTHRASKVHPEYVLYSDNLNAQIREAVNPQKVGAFIVCAGREFRIGDRVINLKNKDDLINGDIGIITDINFAEKEVKIVFNDTEYNLDEERVKDLELAYAITVHKAQGCEFKKVIIPCSVTQRNMMTRKLVYTAVTRAKDSLVFIGDKSVLERACNTIGREVETNKLGPRIVKAVA